MQGALLDDERSLADEAWAKAVSSVPDKVMKFTLNATLAWSASQIKFKKMRKVKSSNICPLYNDGRHTYISLKHLALGNALQNLIWQSNIICQTSLQHSWPAWSGLPEQIHPNDDLRPAADIVLWSTASMDHQNDCLLHMSQMLLMLSRENLWNMTLVNQLIINVNVVDVLLIYCGMYVWQTCM